MRKPNNLPDQKCYLLIHRQGVPTYLEEWDFSKASKEWAKSEFSSGVSHLMLLDETFQTLSERSIFVNNKDGITAGITPNKSLYKPREKVVLEIQLSDMPADTIPASFAISVTDDYDIKLDTTTNIRSEFLLSSELKGQIENPIRYVQNDDEQTVRAADSLMLTRKSRDYHVREAMQGKMQQPKIGTENYQSFTGVLKGRNGKPLKDTKIKMSNLDYGFSEVVLSDEKGRYVFENFEFPDSSAYFFLSYTNKKTTDVNIVPDPIRYPAVTIPWNYGEKQPANDTTLSHYISKADQKYLNEYGMREVDLYEITVKGNAREKKPKRIDNGIFGLPDRSISMDNIKEFPPATFEELFSRIPGIAIIEEKNQVMLRGQSLGLWVNGVLFRGGYNELGSTLNINDIAQVDVYIEMGHPRRGIALTTWPPGSEPDGVMGNTLRMLPLGYQKPMEFNSPQYDTQEKIDNVPLDLRSTIYWKPNVTADSNGRATIEFYAADAPTTYSVVIEGIGQKKTLIYQRANAVIKVK
ncbi:hypothetical protein FACS1894162_8070 [Bacteroidia bacterium]|nr:hypothetical protein FACS1894162_8070 [Bacteroidia bacterium]